MVQSFSDKSINSRFTTLENKILELTKNEQLSKNEKRNLSRFKSDFLKKWMVSCRSKDRFIQTHAKWLSLQMKFFKRSNQVKRKSSNKGRPKVSFEDSSDRSKRMKTSNLRNTSSAVELAYATQMNFRAEGNNQAAKILKDITNTPSKAHEYCNALKNQTTTYTKLSADEALSLLIEAKLSKSQYNLIRRQVKEKNCHIYPSYDEILKAKKRCYPNSIIVSSDTVAEVPMQSMLNHTCKRLLQLQEEVIDSLNSCSNVNLVLICKWGLDGSSGQSEYKQKFDKTGSSDSSIVLTSLVPIRLIYRTETNKNNQIIWQNVRTSSPRFCRPLKLQFIHETAELIKLEKEFVDRQINNIVPFTCTINNSNVTVNFELHFTMIDGKVCNSLTSNKSTQRCYICGACSKDFNNIDNIVLRPANTDNFKYGLSTLHAWIRFFECLLHLAYKMDIKKWQARSDIDKQIVLDTKKRIQGQLRNQIGLIVDKPKPGFGSSNDGNTARRFFENVEVVSNITKIDKQLITKFHVILQTLSSGFDINTDRFKEYALTTARLFVTLYPWYAMPPTIHKILIHGFEVIKSFCLPIGQLSEEAQEARNKDIKKYRADFSRKTSRKDNIRDIINRLLVSSDPCISSLRKLPIKKLKCFLPETFELLDTPKVNNSTDTKFLELSSSDEE